MGKEVGTTVRLRGERAKDFLQKRGFYGLESDENGNFVLGDELFFSRGTEYWFVEATKNREVVVYSSHLKRSGRKNFRKISVDRDGFGRQQVTTGVELIINTNAPVAVFQQNTR